MDKQLPSLLSTHVNQKPPLTEIETRFETRLFKSKDNPSVMTQNVKMGLNSDMKSESSGKYSRRTRHRRSRTSEKRANKERHPTFAFMSSPQFIPGKAPHFNETHLEAQGNEDSSISIQSFTNN